MILSKRWDCTHCIRDGGNKREHAADAQLNWRPGGGWAGLCGFNQRFFFNCRFNQRLTKKTTRPCKWPTKLALANWWSGSACVDCGHVNAGCTPQQPLFGYCGRPFLSWCPFYLDDVTCERVTAGGSYEPICFVRAPFPSFLSFELMRNYVVAICLYLFNMWRFMSCKKTCIMILQPEFMTICDGD